MNRLRQCLQTILFPQENACHLCGGWLAGGMQVCPACQETLAALRLNGTFPAPPGAPLLACAAVWQFRDSARVLVHNLKYHGDATVAQFIGEQMSFALASRARLFCAVDVLAPVPLHATRLKQRGFNQALLLAGEISARTGLPLAREALLRTRATGTLAHGTRAQRLHAICNAFAARPQYVQGRHVLLIDDVFTTGATATACAVALLEAGAQDVSVLTACRVPELQAVD